MRNDGGEIKPYVEKGYWYSRAYVETRWTPAEYSLLTNNQQNEVIVIEDSNMRWQQPPSKIRNETYNWGIRWDGYLRITPGIYAFRVQTNVAIKIDMAIGSGGTWIEVFNTALDAIESEQTYLSRQSFNTDNVSDTYKYVSGSDQATDWVGYVPITIRLYRGGPDKIDPEEVISDDPNLFIKTTKLDNEVNFYKEDFSITLSGSDGSWSVASSSLSGIISILQDTDASVSYRLTAEGDDILTSPITISLSTDGTNVTSSTTGLSATTYTLSIFPDRGEVDFDDNLTALWKSRIASPSPVHTSYSDLTNGSYEPNQQKVPFDLRPEWWKVSEGHPYNQNSSANNDNTPLDGFLRNEFKNTLKSDVDGLGLYGNGSDPVTYSEVPNIILGESRYSSADSLGSNYYGLRLTPNLVGEGGKLFISALPVNSTDYADSTLLGEDDLGGTPNHLTAAEGKVTSNTIKLLIAKLTDTAEEKYDKYFTLAIYDDLASFPVTGDATLLYFDDTTSTYYTWGGASYVEETSPASDNPTTYGLPAFSDSAWLSTITVSVIKAGTEYLASPLTMVVERLELTTGVFFLQFSTTQSSLLTGGDDVADFSGEDIEYYTESNVAFQYLRVDSGEGISFSDVLKLTYNGSTLNDLESEVPRPPSDSVTPFGFDEPQFTSGLCYPPYAIANTFLSQIAIEDTPLYDEPIGNYDVFWGDPTKSGLGGKTLAVTEKLEFQQAEAGESTIIELDESKKVTVNLADYTHRMRIEFPLPSTYDEDVLEHIGSLEKVKESYYAYVKLDS
jgi:hypothetical protein